MIDNFETTLNDLFQGVLEAEEKAREYAKLSEQYDQAAKVAAALAVERKLTIRDLMIEAGKEKAETKYHEIRRQKTQKPVIEQLELLPPQFYMEPPPPPKPVPDKQFIRKMAKGGHPIPGVRMETSEHIVIKVKKNVDRMIVDEITKGAA